MNGYLNALHNRALQRTEEQLFEVIQKEHGAVIKALWETDGAALPNITDHLDEFTREMAKTGYWLLPDLITVIKQIRDEEEKKQK